MKTLEEKLEIMNAALAGATIQFKFDDEDDTWEDTEDPMWDWSKISYRVKPENKQVPYDFSDAESLIGRRFKSIKGNYYYIATRVDKNLMGFGELLYNYGEVAKYLLIWNNTLNSWEPCTKTV